MADNDNGQELTEVLDQLLEETDGEKISLGDLLGALDNRSYGPLLLLIGIIAVSPIGAVPGMSVVTGTLVLLLCAQMLIGRSSPWFPDRLLSIEFSRERLEKTVSGGRPWVKWIEKVIHHRLAFLSSGPALMVVPVISILLALTFYPLALIPLGVLLPGAAIVLLGLGVTARDGILVLLGYIITLCAIAVLIVSWPF